MVGMRSCEDCLCNADSTEDISRVAAVCGRTVAKMIAATIAATNTGARQDLIVRLGETARPIFPQYDAMKRFEEGSSLQYSTAPKRGGLATG
jgi:hypothetical protein